MGQKRRQKRTSKKVYCFIVEGYTEENYIAILRKIYRKSADVKNCGGGNAKGVLKKAKKIISDNKDDYSGYVIWFDRDRYFPSKDTNLKRSLEVNKNVSVYISNPCIEAWLLAHFKPVTSSRSNCSFYENELKRYIPTYHKNKRGLLDRNLNKTRIHQAIINCPTIGEIAQKYFIDL